MVSRLIRRPPQSQRAHTPHTPTAITHQLGQPLRVLPRFCLVASRRWRGAQRTRTRHATRTTLVVRCSQRSSGRGRVAKRGRTRGAESTGLLHVLWRRCSGAGPAPAAARGGASKALSVRHPLPAQIPATAHSSATTAAAMAASAAHGTREPPTPLLPFPGAAPAPAAAWNLPLAVFAVP